MPYMVSYRFICGGCGSSMTAGYAPCAIGDPILLPHVPTGWGRYRNEIYCPGCCASRSATIDPAGPVSLLTNRAAQESSDAAS